MREVGVRELKASLSETLRAVARGEHVRVTLRGHAIAALVPPEAAGREDRSLALIAAGRLRAPARARPVRPPRLAHAGVSASHLLLADRDVER